MFNLTVIRTPIVPLIIVGIIEYTSLSLVHSFFFFLISSEPMSVVFFSTIDKTWLLLNLFSVAGEINLAPQFVTLLIHCYMCLGPVESFWLRYTV